jgi:hypothetical protein
MRGVLMLAALLVPAGASAGGPKPQPTRGPVTVFVTGNKAPKPPTPEELRAMKEKAARLDKQFDELEKADRKQFGKKREKWPPETQTAYYEALDARGVAVTDVWYASPSEPGKADSVEDVAKALGRDAKEPPKQGEAWVAYVATRKEADLVVQIIGRYGEVKFLRGDKVIGFEIVPGRIGARTLAQVPRGWAEKTAWLPLYTYHWLSAREPFFRFGVSDTERWRDVARKVGAATELLVKDNYDLLKPAK